jgi:predicted nucleic acid-binding protein
MTSDKALVLDVNIVMSAVLGARVGLLLERYGDKIALFAPEVVFADARRHLPHVVARRGGDLEAILRSLADLEMVMVVEPEESYAAWRDDALERIGSRDPDDWHVVALAMAVDCPIWTEDNDFFGTGLATWTTDRVEILFRNAVAQRSGEQDEAGGLH